MPMRHKEIQHLKGEEVVESDDDEFELYCEGGELEGCVVSYLKNSVLVRG